MYIYKQDPLTSSRRQTTRLVVTRAHKDAVHVVVVQKVQDASDGSVVGEHLVDLRDGVVGVAGMVDATAFDHQEEALLGLLGGPAEGGEGGPCHLVQGRIGPVLGRPVDLVRDVASGEEAEQG